MTKVACITGASRGIGAAIARSLAEADISTLILIARDRVQLSSLANSLRKEARKDLMIYEMCCDFFDESDVIETVERIAALNINIDILINNAGYTAPNSIFEATASELKSTFSVNVLAPFHLIQGLLRNGNEFSHIVNIASTAGVKGRAGWATYSASKAALIALSDSIRDELGVFGTRVVCVSPGRCATDLRKTLAPEEDPATIMQPEAVAQAVTVLLSDVGRFMDSENLIIRQ